MGSVRDRDENAPGREPRSPANGRKPPPRILVTGASGFVGSRVVRAALDRGYEVVASVRSRSSAARLDGLTTGVKVVEADLGDVDSVRRLASEASPDMAVHLAWSLGPDYDAPENLACVGGSLALLESLVESGCPRIVYVGTHHELLPSASDLAEDAPVAPRNLYAVCKDAVHRVARSYVEGNDVSFVWARLFNVYGPGQDEWAIVSYIVRHLLEGRKCPMTHGEQVRVFLHVRDAAEALLDVAQSTVQGVVHVGSDGATTVRDLALRIGDRLGRRELLCFGEIAPRMHEAPRIVSSNDRLYSEVGFRPRFNLDDGLSDTIDWWRKRMHVEAAT